MKLKIKKKKKFKTKLHDQPINKYYNLPKHLAKQNSVTQTVMLK